MKKELRICFVIFTIILCMLASCSVNNESKSNGSLKEAAKKAGKEDPEDRVIKSEPSQDNSIYHDPNVDENIDFLKEESSTQADIYEVKIVAFGGDYLSGGEQFRSFEKYGAGFESLFDNGKAIKIVLSYNHLNFLKGHELNQSITSMGYGEVSVIGVKYLNGIYNDITFNIHGGGGLTYNKWNYKYPLIIEDSGEKIKSDYLSGFDLTAGLSLGLFQNETHSLSINMDGGFLLFNEKTQNDFNNDLFKPFVYIGLNLEYIFEFY